MMLHSSDCMKKNSEEKKDMEKNEEEVYDADEEKEIRKRLQDLGYI